MSHHDQSSTRPIEVLKMASDLQARYDAFARDRNQNQQASEGEEADGLVSRSTISPTSLESEAAFPATGNPWQDGWRYLSGYAPLELPAAFDMKAPMPGSQTERYRYAAPPEDVHHSRLITQESKLLRVRSGYGIVRQPSWEDLWDREDAAGEFPPTPGVVNVPYEPVIARTEVGAPRTGEDKVKYDGFTAKRITWARENLRAQMVDMGSVAENHVRDTPFVRPVLGPTSRPSSGDSSAQQQGEAVRTFEPFPSSFSQVRGIAYSLEELSRARELERAASYSTHGRGLWNAKASRHDFDYHNLVAAGKIPRAGVVDFPISDIRSTLRDNEAVPRDEGRHRAAHDGNGRMEDESSERTLASSEQGRPGKRRRIDGDSEDQLDIHDLDQRPLPEQPFASFTADDWVSIPDYFFQAVNPPLDITEGQRRGNRPQARSTDG